MSSDSFTEVSSASWFGRIAASIKGILFGGVLCLLAFVLLFWNEGRAVRTAKTIDEGAHVAKSVSAEVVDAANEGKLIHVSGKTATSETLRDNEFGVQAGPAIKLARRVEVYQWKEDFTSTTEKKLGGGTETKTTYTYIPIWKRELIDSSSFNVPAEHSNPKTKPFADTEIAAKLMMLGKFELNASQIHRIEQFKSLPATALGELPKTMVANLKAIPEGYYLGADPAKPQVGDARITFAVVEPGELSVVACQTGQTFTGYRAKTGKTFDLLRTGIVSLPSMIQQEQASNTFLTWFLRVMGFGMMFIGLLLILAPLAVLADVLPILGDIVGFGLALFAFPVAAVLATVTVALAWIVYRPLLGLALLAVAGAVLYFLRTRVKTAKAGPLPISTP